MESQDSIILSRFFFPHFFPLLLSCVFTSKDHYTLSSNFQPTPENVQQSPARSVSMSESTHYLPLAKFRLDDVIDPAKVKSYSIISKGVLVIKTTSSPILSVACFRGKMGLRVVRCGTCSGCAVCALCCCVRGKNDWVRSATV